MIIYVDSSVKPGDSIHIGYPHTDHRPNGTLVQPLSIIEHAEYGDYAGGSVQMSNHRSLIGNDGLKEILVHIIGSHGYRALGYLGDKAPDELQEIISSLEGYPLLDEDDHSALEMELEEEAWKDFGRNDFCEALRPLLRELDPEYDHDFDEMKEIIDDLWNCGRDALNVNGGSGFKTETGGLVYFYIDEWILKARRSPEKLRSHHCVHCEQTHFDLRELAVSCRVIYDES